LRQRYPDTAIIGGKLRGGYEACHGAIQIIALQRQEPGTKGFFKRWGYREEKEQCQEHRIHLILLYDQGNRGPSKSYHR
jgi:hypothetical protein